MDRTQWNTEEGKIVERLQGAYDKLFNAVGKFENSFIAGGCVTSIVLGEEVNDYDIWFFSLEDWEKAAELVKKTASHTEFAAKCGLEVPYVKIVAETKHAITFRIAGVTPVYQIVKSRLGDPQEVIESFDYLHAQVAFHPAVDAGEHGYLEWGGRNCIDFIKEKALVFAGSLDFPIHTLSRVAKFAVRGWRIPDQTLAVLVKEIRKAGGELIARDLAACGEKYAGGEGRALSYEGGQEDQALCVSCFGSGTVIAGTQSCAACDGEGVEPKTCLFA